MNAKHTTTKLFALTLGLLVASLAGCVSTGSGGTTTIDPPKPPGLPKPPAVSVPNP